MKPKLERIHQPIDVREDGQSRCQHREHRPKFLVIILPFSWFFHLPQWQCTEVATEPMKFPDELSSEEEPYFCYYHKRMFEDKLLEITGQTRMEILREIVKMDEQMDSGWQPCELCETTEFFENDVFWKAKPGDKAYGNYEFARMCEQCVVKLEEIKRRKEK